MSEGVVLLITKLTGVAFVTTSMAAAGLAIRPEILAGQLRRRATLGAALAVNFVAAPLIAWGLTLMIPVDPGYAAGILLLGGAAGAPFLPKIAAMGRGDVPLAVALMALLVAGTVLFMPLVMPHILPGTTVRAWDIARPLLVVVVLPLALGIGVRARWDAAGLRAEPVLRHLSDVFLVVFVILMVATHLPAIWGAVGSGAILAAALFVILTGSLGYLLGGPGDAARRVVAFSAAQRNIAAALVTAGQSLRHEPNAAIMVIVSDVVGLITLFVAVAVFRRAKASEHGAGGVGP